MKTLLELHSFFNDMSDFAENGNSLILEDYLLGFFCAIHCITTDTFKFNPLLTFCPELAWV